MKKKASRSTKKGGSKTLPYICKEVLELYAFSEGDVDRLETVQEALRKTGIFSEIYYSNQEEIAYATLVIFLPDSFHVECSKFCMKAFQRWHPRQKKPG